MWHEEGVIVTERTVGDKGYHHKVADWTTPHVTNPFFFG